jgi:hypothetical protein
MKEELKDPFNKVDGVVIDCAGNVIYLWTLTVQLKQRTTGSILVQIV